MLSSRTLRGWYAVHKWTSLVCTLFLLTLCITGLPLIFYHEIDHALGNAVEPKEMPGVTAQVSLDQIVAAARARQPDDAVQFVSRDPEEPELWYVSMGKTADAPEASAFYTFDARTGDFLHEYPLQQGVMYVLYRLHLDMLTGLPGTLFLGVMGLLLVASLVSGTVARKRRVPLGREAQAHRRGPPACPGTGGGLRTGRISRVWAIPTALGVCSAIAPGGRATAGTPGRFHRLGGPGDSCGDRFAVRPAARRRQVARRPGRLRA